MFWGWGWRGMMGGPGFLGGILMLLVWIVIIGLLVWLIVSLLRSRSRGPVQSAPQPAVPGPDPVLETLRRRLAEGAITSQEFDELRQKLGV